MIVKEKQQTKLYALYCCNVWHKPPKKKKKERVPCTKMESAIVSFSKLNVTCLLRMYT